MQPYKLNKRKNDEEDTSKAFEMVERDFLHRSINFLPFKASR
jgi:hypothetical protein